LDSILPQSDVYVIVSVENVKAYEWKRAKPESSIIKTMKNLKNMKLGLNSQSMTTITTTNQVQGNQICHSCTKEDIT